MQKTIQLSLFSTALLSVNSKKTCLELFPADAWPNENTGENLYRVRIDGRWYCALGKYTFLTLAAVGELTATSLLAGGAPVEPEALPEWIGKGVEVLALHGENLEGVPLNTYRGYILDAAQLGPDGRWYVLCQLYARADALFRLRTLSRYGGSYGNRNALSHRIPVRQWQLRLKIEGLLDKLGWDMDRCMMGFSADTPAVTAIINEIAGNKDELMTRARELAGHDRRKN